MKRTNIKNNLVLFSIILVLSLSPLSVKAQQKEKYAHIELLFFQPTEIGKDVLYRLSEMTSEAQSTPASAFNLFNTAKAPDNPVARLSRNYQMLEEYQRLNKSAAYNVLYHIAWVQSRYPIGQEIPIKLLPQRIGNFINATAYLAYHNLYKLKLLVSYDVSMNQEEINIPEIHLLPIRFEKVMTDDKIYHLDHALFGLLAKITEFDVKKLKMDAQMTTSPLTQSEGQLKEQSKIQLN